jgi:hypothetical protein
MAYLSAIYISRAESVRPSEMGLSCFVCEHTFDSSPALNMHLKVYHSLRPTDVYICSQDGCQREFHMLKRLRSHIFSQHKALLSSSVVAVGRDLSFDLRVCK